MDSERAQERSIDLRRKISYILGEIDQREKLVAVDGISELENVSPSNCEASRLLFRFRQAATSLAVSARAGSTAACPGVEGRIALSASCRTQGKLNAHKVLPGPRRMCAAVSFSEEGRSRRNTCNQLETQAKVRDELTKLRKKYRDLCTSVDRQKVDHQEEIAFLKEIIDIKDQKLNALAVGDDPSLRRSWPVRDP